MPSVHAETVDQKLSAVPDDLGRFGRFGGRYVPETLSAAPDQLEKAYDEAIADPEFISELKELFATFVGRPTPLLFAGALLRKRRCPDFTLSERISAIQGLTKSIIRLGRHCLRFAWVSSESLLRLEQASTVLQLQRHVHDLDLNALSIWDQRRSSAVPKRSYDEINGCRGPFRRKWDPVRCEML